MGDGVVHFFQSGERRERKTVLLCVQAWENFWEQNFTPFSKLPICIIWKSGIVILEIRESNNVPHTGYATASEK